jgi:hypothetical protein
MSDSSSNGETRAASIIRRLLWQTSYRLPAPLNPVIQPLQGSGLPRPKRPAGHRSGEGSDSVLPYLGSRW